MSQLWKEGSWMTAAVHYLIIMSHYIIIPRFIARISSSLKAMNQSLCADKTSHYPCWDINTGGWREQCRLFFFCGATAARPGEGGHPRSKECAAMLGERRLKLRFGSCSSWWISNIDHWFSTGSPSPKLNRFLQIFFVLFTLKIF